MLKAIAVCAIGLFALVAAFDWWLGTMFEPSHDEVARVPSPAHRVDAVVVETNGGATTSFGYQVYLVAPGEPYAEGVEVATFYGAIRSGSAYGVNPRWKSPGILVVEYLQAIDATLIRERATVQGETVSVALKGGVADRKAPPGGVLYNRLGRPDDRHGKP